MRKKITILFSLLFIAILAGCGNREAEHTQTAKQEEEAETSGESSDEKNVEISEGENILIAYFGRFGNTEFPDGIDASTSASIVVGKDNNLQGTTEYVASLIQENLGGSLHSIQTAEAYPEDYDATVEQNRREQEDGFIPALQSSVENIDQYDVIFLGYPVWATTIPQPIVSFLEAYDFAGKTVIPFCTHAGYGSGDSYDRIEELCPDARVLDGLAIEAEEIAAAGEPVEDWISRLPLVDLTGSNSSRAEEPEEMGVAEIVITADGTQITARLNGSGAAREFASMLPMTVSTTRMGEHEYYGPLETPLTHTEDLQTGYEVGDLAFWTPGDLFAVYFDEPDDPPEGLMILGQITSDMAVFDNMSGAVEMEIALKNQTQ